MSTSADFERVHDDLDTKCRHKVFDAVNETVSLLTLTGMPKPEADIYTCGSLIEVLFKRLMLNSRIFYGKKTTEETRKILVDLMNGTDIEKLTEEVAKEVEHITKVLKEAKQ